MQYDFKVDLQVYKYFVDEIDENYMKKLENTYDEFRITYNNNPPHDKVNMLNAIEIDNDYNQVLLLGIKDNKKKVLCYYYIGDDKEDEFYKEGIKDFNKMKKYKI